MDISNLRRGAGIAVLAAAGGGVAVMVLPRGLAHVMPAIALVVAVAAGLLMLASRYGLAGTDGDEDEQPQAGE